MNKLLCVIALAFVPHATAAQEPICMPGDQLEAALVDWYGEAPMPETVSSPTSTVRLWASEETGTWTLVTYLIDGTACVLNDGQDLDRSVRGADIIAKLMP
ncbi:S-adenosyl-L-homocysteine hydrolase [Aestuariivita sp.]|uniref:S-adenosyl-L-homocysteine hydrolase n=1 Tax=Aestuariivita sp. TaxID=1872407 RepID=UPI00216F0841|nr:S-adenosyl-L-homocysteine hydrolase [Aestuariivita sp.]MCE8005542.1 S-adenosyl-L-homocysteine hydrolase [Aestuariivita sp.]